MKVLIIDDLDWKRRSIEKVILSCGSAASFDILTADCINTGKKHMYNNQFELLILDLVVPIDKNGAPSPVNAVKFLNEIKVNPSIVRPKQVVGVTNYDEEFIQNKLSFENDCWRLVKYDQSSNSWMESIQAIIYHLLALKLQDNSSGLSERYLNLQEELRNANLPFPDFGCNWIQILKNLSRIVEDSVTVKRYFKNGSKAKFISYERLKLRSEYDFQNMINLVIKPWLPSLEAENLAIIIDGNKKFADFSILNNSIIIEAKYIDTTGKKNDVLKTLSGLQSFYSYNSNVKCLLFLILFEKSVNLDVRKLEDQFSKIIDGKPITVKFIPNVD